MANIYKKVHRSQSKRERNAQNDKRSPAGFFYVRIPVQKACFVLDAIGSKDMKTTLSILTYSPRYVSGTTKKLVESVAANAEDNNNLWADKLYIMECHVSNGPIMKRVHPRVQGRAYRIFKRTGHITIVLDEG